MSDMFPKQVQFKSKLEWQEHYRSAGTASFENFQSNTSCLQFITRHFKDFP